jgi:enolase
MKGAGRGSNTSSVMMETNEWAMRKAFRIGFNFDADNLFNKDPKEPNKYEVEGAKGLMNSAQLVEFLCKMCADHPLITYIEDPVASEDFEGLRKLKAAL